jgi:signal transduction histidine kinase
LSRDRPAKDAVAAFADVASALAESLELPEVLHRIASTVLALSRADGVSVLLRRGGEAELVAHERSAGGPRMRLGYRFPVRPEVLAALDRRRDPLVILGIQDSPLVPEEIRKQQVVRDIVVVPLRAEQELIGAMSLAYRELPERWPLDPALLTALADHMAVAVRTAQLRGEARRSSEQLQQSEKLSALGRLIARVAHELNKPLTTVRLIAEMLEVDGLPPAALEHVRAIAREMERASAIVADLLLLARKRNPRLAAVPLAEVVREVVADHGREFVAAGVRIALDLPGDLPAVRADRRGLHHILSNLIVNALQAMEKHDARERRLTIRAHVARAAGDGSPADGAPPERVVLTVADTGPGISADALPHIFEPFFTTKPAGEGTGMGLAIVKEIVDEHGGEVVAENGPAGGAVFRVSLPIATAADAAAAPEPPAQAGAAGAARPAEPAPRTRVSAGAGAPAPRPAGAGGGEPAGTRARVRVLVIDDEPGLHRAIRRVLEYFGCEVTTSSTGEGGLALAASGEYDIILCDIRMPDLDGRELYDRLEREAPAAARRLAFMTGDTISDEIRVFLKATGRPTLAKPFGREQLAAFLRRMGVETA